MGVFVFGDEWIRPSSLSRYPFGCLSGRRVKASSSPSFVLRHHDLLKQLFNIYHRSKHMNFSQCLFVLNVSKYSSLFKEFRITQQCDIKRFIVSEPVQEVNIHHEFASCWILCKAICTSFSYRVWETHSADLTPYVPQYCKCWAFELNDNIYRKSTIAIKEHYIDVQLYFITENVLEKKAHVDLALIFKKNDYNFKVFRFCDSNFLSDFKTLHPYLNVNIWTLFSRI